MRAAESTEDLPDSLGALEIVPGDHRLCADQ